MKGLFMFRKNMPFGFVRMVNMCLGHPMTRFLDRNNLRVALELFDFDINKLNSDLFVVEQDVFLAEGLKSEGDVKDKACSEVFFPRVEESKQGSQGERAG